MSNSPSPPPGPSRRSTSPRGSRRSGRSSPEPFSPRSPSRQQTASSKITRLDSFNIGEVIGHGYFSTVHIAISTVDRQPYAIKKVQLDRLDSPQFNLIEDEIRNMSSLNNRGLLKLESTLVSSVYCIYVLPLMIHRSCDQIIRRAYPNGLPEPAVGMIIKDILNALSYLHDRNIIHRGIKASHILISETGAAVLTGFRYMLQIPPHQTQITAVNNTLSEMTRYLNWLSPEMLLQFKRPITTGSHSGATKRVTSEDSSGFGLNSDMYSIGITCCELANGVEPYSEVSPSGILIKKLEEPAPKLYDRHFLPSQEASGTTPPYLPEAPPGILRNPRDEPYKRKNISLYFHNFVAVCVVNSPHTRISCEQAQRLKFIMAFAKASSSELLKLLPLLSPPLEYRLPAPAGPAMSAQSSSESDWDFSS